MRDPVFAACVQQLRELREKKRRAERSPEHRAERREQGKRDSAAFRSKRKVLLNDLKRRPCADCGGAFDPVCMDFDHRDPTTKIANIARLAHAATLPELLAEIAKCDLVCANCHRIRTHGLTPPPDESDN